MEQPTRSWLLFWLWDLKRDPYFRCEGREGGGLDLPEADRREVVMRKFGF